MPAEEAAARFRYGRTLSDSLTNEAQRRADAAGLTAVDARTAEGNPARVILETAASERVDMSVLGSRGVSEPHALMLGSTCVTVK